MANYLNNTELVNEKPKYARGLRNNNPGNLVRTSIGWQGKIPFTKSKDTKFEQFYELRYGLHALMRDIVSDIKKGQNNIIKLINEFAPGFENNTPAYINSVVKSVGLAPNALLILSEEQVTALAKAIVRVELGSKDAKLVLDSDYTAAMALNADLKLKKKVTPPKL